MNIAKAQKSISSAQNQIRAKRQPFFSKEGRNNFFSKSNETSSFFSPTAIQPKFTIGRPNDKYEQEADTMADQVMKMSTSQIPPIQRKCEACEEEEKLRMKPISTSITPIIQRQIEEENNENLIQAKATAGVTSAVTPAIGAGIQSLRGGGQPLPKSERSFFEPRFGADFSGVRVHSDARAAGLAQSVNARAFAHGNNVVFGAGKYSPNTSSGRKLLAHELTHVVQQGGASPVSNDLVQKAKSNGYDPIGFHIDLQQAKPRGSAGVPTLQLAREVEQRMAGGLRWFLEADPPSPIIRQGAEVTFRLRNSTQPSEEFRGELAGQAQRGHSVRLGGFATEVPISSFDNPEFGVIDGLGREYPWRPGELARSFDSYPIEFVHTFNQLGRRVVFFRGTPQGLARHGGTRRVYASYEIEVARSEHAPVLEETADISSSDEAALRSSETRYGELGSLFQRLAIRRALELLSDNKREAIQLSRHYQLPAPATESARTRTARQFFVVYGELVARRATLNEELSLRPLSHQRSGRHFAPEQTSLARMQAPVRARLREVESTIQQIQATYPEAAAAHRHEANHPTSAMTFSTIAGVALRQVQSDIDETRHRLVTGDIPILSVRSVTDQLLSDLAASNPDVRTAVALMRQDQADVDLWLQLGTAGVSIALLFFPGIGPFLSAGVGLGAGTAQAVRSWEEAEDYATGANAGVGRGLFTTEEAEERRSSAIWDSVFVVVGAADFGFEATRLFRAARAGAALRRAARVRELAETEELVEVLGGVNPMTRDLLESSAELREAVRRYPRAANAFKLCDSPCLPPIPPASQADYARFDELLERMEARNITYNQLGFDDEPALRRHLHDASEDNQLADALENLHTRADEAALSREVPVVEGESGFQVRSLGRGAEPSPSQALGRNLGPRPTSVPHAWQAHHIIPFEWRDHPVIDFISRRFDWEINGAGNGIYLPSSDTVVGRGSRSVHFGDHPVYNRWIEDRLEQINHRWTRRDSPISDEQMRDEVEALVLEFGARLENGQVRLRRQ